MAFRWYAVVSAVILSISLSVLVLPAGGMLNGPVLIASAQPLDTDLDGDPDATDSDDDGDGVDDWADYAPLDPKVQYAPPISTDPPAQNPDPVAPNIIDSDGDGLPDTSDFDNDNDGVIDSEDHEPLNPPVQYPPTAPENPVGNSPPLDTDTGSDYEQDSDGDGIPNHLDPDDDSDAIEDRDDPVEAPVQEGPVQPAAPTPPAPGGEDEKQVGGPVSRNTTTSSAVPVVSALPKTGSGSESVLPVVAIVVIAGLGILGVRVRSKNPSER